MNSLTEMIEVIKEYPLGTVLHLKGEESQTDTRIVTGYELTNRYSCLRLDHGGNINIRRLTGPNSMLIKKEFKNEEHSVNDGIETFSELDD